MRSSSPLALASAANSSIQSQTLTGALLGSRCPRSCRIEGIAVGGESGWRLRQEHSAKFACVGGVNDTSQVLDYQGTCVMFISTPPLRQRILFPLSHPLRSAHRRAMRRRAVQTDFPG